MIPSERLATYREDGAKQSARPRLPGGAQRRRPHHRAEEPAYVREHWIADQPARPGIRGGGLLFFRIANTFSTARHVADAL